MASEGICEWTGASGTEYRYNIYPIGRRMKTEDGNYIYARHSYEHGKEVIDPIYIGQGNLRDRSNPGNDRRGKCIRRCKPTHFHCHRKNANQGERIAEETDLRNHYHTPCNEQ